MSEAGAKQQTHPQHPRTSHLGREGCSGWSELLKQFISLHIKAPHGLQRLLLRLSVAWPVSPGMRGSLGDKRLW